MLAATAALSELHPGEAAETVTKVEASTGHPIEEADHVRILISLSGLFRPTEGHRCIGLTLGFLLELTDNRAWNAGLDVRLTFNWKELEIRSCHPAPGRSSAELKPNESR